MKFYFGKKYPNWFGKLFRKMYTYMYMPLSENGEHEYITEYYWLSRREIKRMRNAHNFVGNRRIFRQVLLEGDYAMFSNEDLVQVIKNGDFSEDTWNWSNHDEE